MDDFWIQVAGLLLAMVGALIVTVADTWLSRSLLNYLDAIENHLEDVLQTLRTGEGQFHVLEIDRKRDRWQDRARAIKTLGWLALTAGFALQLAALWFTRFTI